MGSEVSLLLLVGHPAPYGPRWSDLPPALCSWRRPVRLAAGSRTGEPDTFEPDAAQFLGRRVGGPLDCSVAPVTSRHITATGPILWVGAFLGPLAAPGPAGSSAMASSWSDPGGPALGGRALW